MLGITNHWEEHKALNNKNSDKIVDGNVSQLLGNQFNGIYLKMFLLFNLAVLLIVHRNECLFHQNVYKNVYSIFFCNNSKLEMFYYRMVK